MNYKLVLGLEIHIQVKTLTKMFCGCSTDVWGAEPNTHTCPTCLGLPGALPVPNFEAVQKTQLLGLALGCKLNRNSKFDRKHYFYPDLPKGYQISQYKEPLCEGGQLELSSGNVVELERIHLEEDTAKSFHEGDKTLIDFNVSCMPLMEIVTKPVIVSAEDAVEFGRRLRDLVRLLGVSDADMEKGNLRLEPNISVRTEEMEQAGELPNYKVEVKNINSFRFMEKAINYEIMRQSEALENGETLVQENRGWDEHSGKTLAQRSKEEAHDYRYFPEPDIPPMSFDEAHFEKLKAQLPELPWVLEKRLVNDHNINSGNAREFANGSGLELVSYLEELIKNTNVKPNKIANLILNKKDYRNLSPQEFEKKFEEANTKLTDITQLQKIIDEVCDENPDVVEQLRAGKENTAKFLLGQVMKKTQGKADPQVALELLKKV